MKRHSSPYEQLGDFASRVTSARADQPSQVDFDSIQIAIGFTLCGQLMSASIGDVTEIINVPDFTPIPGTKNWMLGMANVRGNLLPIVDLEAFFGSALHGSRRQHRVLVIENGGHRCGLLVSSVSGLQNLEADRFVNAIHENDAETNSYINHQYEYEEQTWSKFETSRLFDSADFVNAANTRATAPVNAA